MNSSRGLMLITVLFILSAVHAIAVPGIIDYQGRVLVPGDPDPVPFTGQGSFKFAIVDDPTSPTVSYWSNDGSSVAGSEPTLAENVQVDTGLFNVLLGKEPEMPPIDPSVFVNDPLYLRIWFDDGSHGFQSMTPDQRITGVCYAMNSGLLNGYGSDEFVLKSGDIMTGNLEFNGGDILAGGGTIDMEDGTITNCDTLEINDGGTVSFQGGNATLDGNNALASNIRVNAPVPVAVDILVPPVSNAINVYIDPNTAGYCPPPTPGMDGEWLVIINQSSSPIMILLSPPASPRIVGPQESRTFVCVGAIWY